jgi:hypothetical protein
LTSFGDRAIFRHPKLAQAEGIDMTQEIERIAGSLERLYQDGGLAEQTSNALQAPRIKAAIERGLGEQSPADELLLATILVDDSLSIAPNIDEIRRGHNAMLAALRETSSSADVRVLTRALNRGILSQYRPIDQAMTLDTVTFSGRHLSSNGTPLYRQSLVTLGTVMVKAREEEDRGAKVRTFTLIITDAEDNRSEGIAAKDVHLIVADMMEFATNHIVAGMGVGERPGIDFRAIFRDMGIPERWMFASAATSDDIRKEFERIVKDLRLAASSETQFLQLVAGSSDAGSSP